MTVPRLAACIVLLLASLARAELLPEGWEYRRQLAFKQAASDAPGDNVAWAEFFVNGKQLPDGADFRVTTADRTLVPHKLLLLAGDQARIAFATRGDGPYYVWWGNSKAARPAKDLEIKRGVFVQSYPLTTAGRNINQLQRALDRAGAPDAASFIDQPFIGYDVAGDSAPALIRYTTQFKIDAATTADIALSTQDVGTLAIDGNIEVQDDRPGMQPRARDSKTLTLKPGWHTMEITQAAPSGINAQLVVAWQKSGEKAYAPLPANLFAPVVKAVANPLEHVGKTYDADFAVEPQSEAFVPPDNYMLHYAFEARYPEGFNPKISWDFGDGQTGKDLRRVHHIFLAPGMYPVTLKLEQAGTTYTTTIRLVIKDRLYARFPQPPADTPKTVRSVLDTYDVAKLSGDQALRGMQFFEAAPDQEQWIKWGRVWLASKDTAGERLIADESTLLARTMLDRKDATGAAEIYRLAAAKPLPMELRATLMRRGVMVLADDADQPDEAVKEAQAWLKKIDSGDRKQVHIVNCALAYAAIAAADGKLAQQAITAAGADGPLSHTEAELRQGVLARNIENYIATKDYAEAENLLDDWDSEFPLAMWDGFTRTLRVKLRAAQGRPLTAARIALAHAKANPDGFYAAELVYRASQYFDVAGQKTQAAAALDLLKSKYPESPYARGEKKD